VVLLNGLHHHPLPLASETVPERRQRLIDAYGMPNEQGIRRAHCTYCGATSGPIEVEHIVPLSRGGTDAQRMSSATVAQVEQAIADGQILRTWPMRGTIHFMPPDDAQR
jgi:hypothetical protein